MRLAEMTIDLTVLGVLAGIATKVLPAMAGLLAVVYYGFVIYDRIKYGPDIEGRLLRPRHKHTIKENPNGSTDSK